MEEELVMDKMKPCPFCGGEAKSFVHLDSYASNEVLMSAYVKCSVCGVYQRLRFNATSMQFKDFIDAFNNAIGLWNQRA